MPPKEPIDPAVFLQSVVGRRVAVKLKWGQLYVGTLMSVDAFMNALLADCSEHEASGAQSLLGDVLVRCNNVLYVRELPQAGDLPDLFAR
jgi:small nuclear ribonucleoprotein F